MYIIANVQICKRLQNCLIIENENIVSIIGKFEYSGFELRRGILNIDTNAGNNV